MNTQCTLKIRSNIRCKIYIDDDYKATANKESLTKIVLDKGEYWVRVEDESCSNNHMAQKVILNQDKVMEVNLEEMHPLEKESADLKRTGNVGGQKAKATRNVRYIGQPIDLIFDVIAALFCLSCIVFGIVKLAYGEVVGLIGVLLGVVMGALRMWARKDYYIS